MPIEIRLATSEADRRAIYRFRYEVYVEELGFPQVHADHRLRTIREPMDEDAHLVAAWCDGRLVGTMRFNYATGATLQEYEDFFQLRRFEPFFPFRVTVTTKLMMARGFRDGLLSMRLYAAALERGIRNGVCFNFMGSNLALLPYYRRLGCRDAGPERDHSDYGRVRPMVYLLHDIDYLRQIGSPLASFAPRGADDSGSVEFFHQHFGAGVRSAAPLIA